MSFPSVTDACEQAKRLLNLRKHDEANELLAAALVEFPDEGALLQIQGLVWHAQKRYSSAREALELAGTLIPLSLPAQLVLADSYRRSEQRGDARTILTYLATRSDMPTHLLPTLTAGLGALGDYQLALEICREASRREPDRDEVLFGMAYYMNKLDYPVECVLPLLRRAVSLDPKCQLYRMGLATTCVKAQLWHEAYELFCGIRPEGVRCRGCLCAMAHVFDRSGDHVRRDACLCRMLQVERTGEAASADQAPELE